MEKDASGHKDLGGDLISHPSCDHHNRYGTQVSQQCLRLPKILLLFLGQPSRFHEGKKPLREGDLHQHRLVACDIGGNDADEKCFIRLACLDD